MRQDHTVRQGGSSTEKGSKAKYSGASRAWVFATSAALHARTHVGSGSFLYNAVPMGGANVYMGFPHCDRDAEVVDVFDKTLWPLPRWPASAACSSA